MAFNMEKHQTGVFFILLCILCFSAVRSMMLIELDDSFPDRRKDTAWLVMFYAPWCGHCKKLEPTFYQVAMDLDGTEIRVGKLDATQYASVASLYDVRGYPTIKFLRGDTDFTHKSDRSRNGIVQFAKRAYGPQIRRLSNQGRLYDTRSEHSDGVFFLYIGDHDEHADLMIKYKDVAEKYAVSGYFYAGDRNVLPINIMPTQYPTIYVYKDGHHFEIQHPEEGITKSHLEEFFIHEQFTQFPKIESGGGLNDFAILPKKLVIVVVEEYEQNETLKFHGDRAKSISEFLAKQNRDTYHGDFQFAWMGDLETARSLTMSHMAAPNLFVLDPSNHYYYLPSFDTIGMTQNDLVEFLADVQDGKMPAYGGTGIVQGVKRFFYDIVVTVYDLYRTAGWLTFVIFGVPALVISIVCYAMCCMEPFDDSIFEREYWVEQERLAKLAAEGKLDENGEEIIDDDEKKRLLDDAEAGPEGGAEGESPPPPPPLEPCADADGHMKKD